MIGLSEMRLSVLLWMKSPPFVEAGVMRLSVLKLMKSSLLQKRSALKTQCDRSVNTEVNEVISSKERKKVSPRWVRLYSLSWSEWRSWSEWSHLCWEKEGLVEMDLSLFSELRWMKSSLMKERRIHWDESVYTELKEDISSTETNRNLVRWDFSTTVNEVMKSFIISSETIPTCTYTFPSWKRMRT